MKDDRENEPFYDAKRPIYEFSQKGMDNQQLVFKRVYDRVHAAIAGKPCTKENRDFVRDEITKEYEVLEREGYLVKQHPRAIHVTGVLQ